MDEPVGIVVEQVGKGAYKTHRTNKALIVIAKNNSPQGWFLVTSYPTID